MTEKRTTKKEFYAELISRLDGNEAKLDTEAVKAFIEHEIDLLDNKHGSGTRKPSKTQKENETLKDCIVAALTNSDTAMTVAELMKAEGLEECSNQKVTALLRLLRKDGIVRRVKEKRVSKFELGQEETEITA